MIAICQKIAICQTMGWRRKIAAWLVGAALVAAPARAAETVAGCKIGDICTLQGPLFGCKDFSDIKRWIDIYVEIDRNAAEKFVDDQIASGECTRFHTGEKLKLLRYLGLRRLEVRRPGETQIFIMLLK